MFAEQAARLEELRGIVPDELIRTLREIVGNPTQPLVHRGPVEFAGPTPDGAEDAAAVYIGTRYEALVRGKLLGAVKYAQSVEAYRTVYNTRAGVDEYWIKCRKCAKHTGEGIDGPSFDVLLLPTGGNLPDVDSGDVIAYLRDEHRVRVGLFCCTCTAAVESSSAGSSSGSPASSASPVSSASCGADCLKISLWDITDGAQPCSVCLDLNGDYELGFHTQPEVEPHHVYHRWRSCAIPCECSCTGYIKLFAEYIHDVPDPDTDWFAVYLVDATEDQEWTTPQSCTPLINMTLEARSSPTNSQASWDLLCGDGMDLYGFNNAATGNLACIAPEAELCGKVVVGPCPDCGGSSSSSSGSPPPSSSPSSGSPPSESEPSESEPPSESSEAGPTIDVVVCAPYRSGDDICFPQKRIHLPPGTTIEDLPETCVYVCCPGSASSEDGGSE